MGKGTLTLLMIFTAFGRAMVCFHFGLFWLNLFLYPNSFFADHSLPAREASLRFFFDAFAFYLMWMRRE
jgi:hypothetical protein